MKKISILVMVASLMFVSVAVGQEITQSAGPHNLEFGLMCYHFDYEEDLTPPLKSTEDGWLPGIYLGYVYQKPDDLYTKVFIEFTDADTDYDGTTMAGIPVTGTTDNTFFRFEWDIGYTFDTQEGSSLCPYTGYGYRSWMRGLGGTAPYDEKYTWHYIPIGIKGDLELNDRWSVGANIAARLMFGGEIAIYYSDIDPGYNDPEVDLGDEIGWFFEFPVRYRFDSNWSFVGTPWYEYSEIGKSDETYLTYYGAPVATVYEPASTTHQYGINFGVTYSFQHQFLISKN